MATENPPVAALAEGLDTNLDVITYGDADWALSYVLPYYGGDCVRSGQIDDEEFSEMQITVGGAGTLTFWWRAYSESNDTLSFYIDDVERCDPISGDEHIEWEEKSFNITGETNHTLRWRYAKNGWAAAGDDCGYVDCLQWTGGGPIPPPEPEEPPEPEWLTVSYTYDAAGRRIEKKVDGVVEVKYVYDGDHLIAEYDGSDTLLRKYIYGPCIDEPICMINATEGYQDTYYYHYDALGSVVALTNGAGTAVQFYEYSVYGQVSASDPNHPNRFMFTGREFDKDTGLYYYRARYYNPEIGRFLQTDSVGYEAGMNLYRYCGNSPAIGVDPYGLDDGRTPPLEIQIAFYDPGDEDAGLLGEMANDFTRAYDPQHPAAWPGVFPMKTWKDVIRKLQELKDSNILVTAVYFYDHCHRRTWDQIFDTHTPGRLEFGSSLVPVDKDARFWHELSRVTDPCTVLHFRQCYAGHEPSLTNVARWTKRTVTGCVQENIMFGERGDPQKIDIPDYDFGGPVMKAAPVLDQKGEVISIDFGYYWRYRPGELGTNRQPY